MIDVVVDANRLSTLWDQRWPGCSKLPYEVREIRDQWVRFHALPGSQRYPDTEIEYGIVLARHNTVLAELVTGPAVLVITAGYSDQPDPREPGRSAETIEAHRSGAYWTSSCIDDEPGFESWMHLYASETTWSPGCLDPLLRHVSDGVIGNVLVCDVVLSWLYHPYDGGMDIVLPTTADRDALRSRHQDWLSAHPRGL
ncbi:hypothetical protein [Verrucosispora sp. NA02020]|uniref:DUF3885 domain-containing protein n=1 Tax=Verrucosispora sp. NA02020 TaxID=2742132 RepID=UPI0015928B03|nr:hypothetical protein [Verrucosispora sp. NA02020]QKW13395.1 hypothetical protein HUT12_11775 [Verrucosispora sp. NA02020]